MGSLLIQNKHFISRSERRTQSEIMDFWVPLMMELLPVFTEVEVRSYEDDRESIRLMKPFAHTIRFENGLIIFSMPLTQKLKDLLLHASMKENEIIRWFDLLFKRNGVSICSIKQYGAEIYFHQLNSDDAEEIQSYFPEGTVFDFKE